MEGHSAVGNSDEPYDIAEVDAACRGRRGISGAACQSSPRRTDRLLDMINSCRLWSAPLSVILRVHSCLVNFIDKFYSFISTKWLICF